MKKITSNKNTLINSYYKKMIEPLSCRQFREIMGKNYAEMPAIIRKVTKNKTVLYYATALEYVVTGESKFLDQLQKMFNEQQKIFNNQQEAKRLIEEGRKKLFWDLCNKT